MVKHISTIIILLAVVFLLGTAIAESQPIPDTEPILEYEIEEETEEPVEEGVGEEDNEVEYASDLDKYRYMIRLGCQLYEIDSAELVISVARLETANFSSDLFVNGHNFGGITRGTLCTYETETEGLRDFLEVMKYYVDHYETVEEMGIHYCESSDWAYKVRQIMKEEEQNG